MMLPALLLLLAQDESVLRLSWGVPDQLDPHRASTAAEARYVAALFEGLTGAAEDGVTPVPGMAMAWEESADGLTWIFRLRAAAWSTGDPVVAGDFVYAWRRALRLGTGCPFLDLFRALRNADAWIGAQEADAILDQYEDLKAGQAALVSRRLEAVARLRHVEALRRRGEEIAAKAAERRPDVGERELGVEAVDDRTLRVTLERRTPWLAHLVSLHAFVPLHAKTVDTGGADWVKPARITTNGPYAFAEATASRILLTRQARYWDPALREAPARIEAGLHTPEVAIAKYREGKLDWIAREQVPEAESKTLPGRLRFDAWGATFLRMNVKKAPFDRPGVRAAFARGVDRRPLAEALDASPATGLVPPGYPGWEGAAAPAFDAAAAMEGLLRETDFDLSKLPAIELLAPDVLGLATAGESLRGQLEKSLGVTVKLRVMKLPAYLRAAAAGDFHLALGAWLGDAFDPATFLEGWTGGHANNAGGWANGGFDALLAKAAAEPAARLGLLAKAEALALADAALIPLTWTSEFLGASPRVQGLKPNPLGRFPLKYIRLAK